MTNANTALHNTMPTRNFKISPLLWILFGAALLRLACIILIEIAPVGDFLDYWLMATSRYSGQEMVDRGGNYAHMSCGYPYFLYALFHLTGPSLWAAKLVNIPLALVTIFLIYQLAKTTTGSQPVSLLAASIWSLYAPSILYCEYLAKENLMIPMMLGELLLLTYVIQNKRPMLSAGLAGTLMGLLLVVAASLLMLLPVALIAIVLSPQPWLKRLAMISLYGLTILIALVPWFTHTDRLFGRPLLTTSGGMNLWVGNNAKATAMFKIPDDTVGDSGMTWREVKAAYGENEADQIAKNAAISFIKANPGKTLSLMCKKFVIFWWPPLHERVGGGKATVFVMMIWVVQYAMVCGFALVGLLNIRRNFNSFWLIYVTIALYVLMHLIVYVIFRYRLPVEPLLDILAAEGFWIAFQKVRTRRTTAAQP